MGVPIAAVHTTPTPPFEQAEPLEEAKPLEQVQNPSCAWEWETTAVRIPGADSTSIDSGFGKPPGRMAYASTSDPGLAQ
jgi:hypothetical protein